ncbi:MAG: hypothetical protein AB7O50_00415 [Pseudolabrys sp.]
MRLFVAAAALTGLAASALLTTPADAQSRKRYTSRDGHTVIISRDETGRTRTRVVVQKRSYLDGGTEVAPGERKYRDYVEGPFSWMPYRVIDDNARSHRSPLPGPFTLPFNSNPMQP